MDVRGGAGELVQVQGALDEAASRGARLTARWWALSVAMLSALLGGCAAERAPAPTRPPVATANWQSPLPARNAPERTATSIRDRTLVGAYYYLWNPQNLDQGWLRNRLSPPQRDMQAQARAADGGAADDIREASSHGVDFFAVDWWPGRPRQNAGLDRLLEAPNAGDMRFCIFYEMQQLGSGAADGSTFMGARQAARLATDFADLSQRYFTRPNYLKVDGRPVVVLYLTRTLVGDVAGAVAAARSAARTQGFEVLLIGDEIFWDVQPDGSHRRQTTTEPQSSRALLFDALTAYNLYEPARRELSGPGATSAFLADTRGLFEQYRAAIGDRIPLVPGVIPGFNDRGVRSMLHHPVIPRVWSTDVAAEPFFAHALDDFAIPLADARLPMVLVSTWNEWNEDTAIEPTLPTPPTVADDSRSGRAFTNGYPYFGNGTTYVDVIRDRFGNKRPPNTERGRNGRLIGAR